MSDARRCDGPDCQAVAEEPYLGWWRLESAGIVRVIGLRDELDFCSWACLGAFVMDESGAVAEIERRLGELG